MPAGAWGALTSAAAFAFGGTIGAAGLLHLARPLRWRSRATVSAVTLAPASLVPAAAAELALILLRRRTAAVAGAAVLAGCAITHIAPYRRTVASRHRMRRADVEVTVMTANLLHGKADPEPLARTVQRHQVDVLCVQEVHQAALDLIADRTAELLPHHHTLAGSRGGGSGIFSRFPLTNRAEPEGYGFPPVMADVMVPIAREPGVRPITLLSFHSKAPLGNRDARPWADDLALVGGLMRGHQGSLIVAGDFNATREHRQFRDLLTGGFTDAAGDAGAGLMFTFPGTPRAIPLGCLDHVVVGRGLTGIAAGSVPIIGSDHRAVIARIAAD